MKIIISVLFFCFFLFSQDINALLYKIDVHNDLSSKTKKENSGVMYLFTRRDIESLQIFHLRDILKLLPIGYSFNRYSVIDVFNPNSNIPFLSSTIKVFINDEEITSGLYNSGLAVFGDMDLKWVDHIEVYTQAPSFEISSEPSLVVIKLYTKDVSRDEGIDIFLSKESKGEFGSIEFANKYNFFNFYNYFAYDNDKSSFHNSKFRKNLLMEFYNEKISFFLNGYISKRDGFLGFDIIDYPDKSYIKDKFLHLGVKANVNKNITFLSSINLTKNNTYYFNFPFLFLKDNKKIETVYVSSFDRVIDLNLIYKCIFDKNFFIAGSKNRFKYFNFSKLLFNEENVRENYNKFQNVYTLFSQFSHFFSKNSLFNIGYSFSFFKNDKVNNQKTKQIRVSHTFLMDKFIFKTSFSHIEYTIDPYLLSSFFSAKDILKPAKIDNIFEEIKYNSFLFNIDLAFGFFISKDYFFPNKEGLLDNLNKRMRENYLAFRYTLRYKPFSKFNFSYYLQYIHDMPKFNIYRIHKIAIYNYHTHSKFNLFEEFIVDKSEDSKFYYDFSAGVKYLKNENLSFFLKGENLLNRAKSYDFFLFNPINKEATFLRVPLIERRVYLGMEYLF